MTKKWFWSLLWIPVLTAALQGQSRESILKTIQENSKWTPADQPVLYNDKNIESLEGKRASTLNRYGLTGVTVQKWDASSGAVRLMLYEMLDPAAAYGLFTLERNTHQSGFTAVPVGTEGFRIGNRMEFWQSKYLVKLEGSPAAEDELARTI